MRTLHICLSLTALLIQARAEHLSIPRSYFNDPHFIKAFVASYGAASPIEPELDREEKELLTQVGDLFADARFVDAEARIVDFIKKRKNPTDPETKPKDVSPALVFVLGNLYFQSGRLKDAERAFQLALDKHPDFLRAHKNLALLYASQDRIDQSMPHLKKSIQLGESDHRSFGLLGYGYLRAKKPLAAEGAYRQAYLLAPDEKDWKLGLAQTLLLQEKWPEAAAMLGELIDEQPENPDLWKQQANCYLGMDQRMRAAENFEVMRLKGIADEDTLNLLGDIYMDQEAPLLALGAYLSALSQANTLNVDRSLKTAQILSDFGAPLEAQQYIDEVWRKGSSNLTREQKLSLKLIQVKVARSLNQTTQLDSLLNEILTLDPMNGEALVAQGQFYEAQAEEAETDQEKLKLRSKARSSFQLAMKLDDQQAQYDGNLRFGQMMVRQRDYLQALPHLETALTLKESDNLKQYVRQVQRAAQRQKERETREETQRQQTQKALQEQQAQENARQAEAANNETQKP